MIVVDASVVAPALADDGSDGAPARRRLSGERPVAPALLDPEVLAVGRRQRASDAMDEARAAAVLRTLFDLPVTRVEVRLVLCRCWELRHVPTRVRCELRGAGGNTGALPWSPPTGGFRVRPGSAAASRCWPVDEPARERTPAPWPDAIRRGLGSPGWPRQRSGCMHHRCGVGLPGGAGRAAPAAARR